MDDPREKERLEINVAWHRVGGCLERIEGTFGSILMLAVVAKENPISENLFIVREDGGWSQKN
jgi:hypothetical protein